MEETEQEKPLRTWVCDCGETIEVWRSDPGCRDQLCECGQWFNAFGQRLRDDWHGNPSTWDDEIGDLEGYEIQHANDW